MTDFAVSQQLTACANFACLSTSFSVTCKSDAKLSRLGGLKKELLFKNGAAVAELLQSVYRREDTQPLSSFTPEHEPGHC